MSGMGVVAAVGSGVKGLSVNDMVVSKGSLGGFRAMAKAPAASFVKVPANVPAEYAGVLSSAATASLLLKGVAAGDVVVQSGASSLVGQAVVQLARAKGIVTVSVVAPSTDEEDMVGLLKSLGGDVVVPSAYPHCSSWRFKALLADLPAPALAITFEDAMDDQGLAAKAKAAAGSVSKLRAALDGASKADVNKLKVLGSRAPVYVCLFDWFLALTHANSCHDLVAGGGGGDCQRQGVCQPRARGQGLVQGRLGRRRVGRRGRGGAPARVRRHGALGREVSQTMSCVTQSALLRGCIAQRGRTSLLCFRYPLEDFAYATKRAQGPYPGFRQMVAAFE
jgi:hypothetical protein